MKLKSTVFTTMTSTLLMLALLVLNLGCQDVIVDYSDSQGLPSEDKILKGWYESLPISFNSAQALSSFYSYNPKLAMNDSGHTIIVWEQFNGFQNQIYKAEYKNGTWIYPKNFSDALSLPVTYASDPKVSLNNNGHAVITWKQNDLMYDQLYKAELKDHKWSLPVDLNDKISLSGSYVSSHEVAINNSGDIIIAWVQSNTVSINQVFISEYRSGTWTSPINRSDHISQPGQYVSSFDLDLNDSGEALIAWSQYDGSQNQIYISEFRSNSWVHPNSLTDNISPNSTSAYEPSISINDAGDSIVAWRQYNGSYDQIFKSEYRSGTWTHPTGLADKISPTGSYTYAPDTSISNNGDAIITWAQNDGSQNQIFKSEYRSNIWTHPANLTDNISTASTYASDPKPAINDNGDTILVWSQSDGSFNQIFKSEYRSGAWTHPTNLTDNISPDGQYADTPYASINNLGESNIVWKQNDGSQNQIFKSEYRSNIWTHPANLTDNISIDYQVTLNQKILFNDNGDIIITWTQKNNNSQDQLYLSEFRNGVWTHPNDLNDSLSLVSNYSVYDYKVSLNENGDTLIVWAQYDGTNTNLYLAEYRNQVWNKPSLPTHYIFTTTYSINYPALALNEAGTSLLSWVSSDGANDQIFKSEFRSGSWTHPANLTDNISPDGYSSQSPQIALNESGHSIIVWKQYTSGNIQLFMSENSLGIWDHPNDINDFISPSTNQWIYGDPVVALNEPGKALVVWVQNDGTNNQLYKSEKLNGSWNHPTSSNDHISPTGSYVNNNPQVDINFNGDALIVWSQNNGTYDQIFMSELRQGIWNHPNNINDHISSTGSYANNPQVQINNKNDALIIWQQSLSSDQHLYKSEYLNNNWNHPSNINDHISFPGAVISNPKLSLSETGHAMIFWKQNNDVYTINNFNENTWSYPTPGLHSHYVNTYHFHMSDQGKVLMIYNHYSSDPQKNGLILMEHGE